MADFLLSPLQEGKWLRRTMYAVLGMCHHSSSMDLRLSVGFPDHALRDRGAAAVLSISVVTRPIPGRDENTLPSPVDLQKQGPQPLQPDQLHLRVRECKRYQWLEESAGVSSPHSLKTCRQFSSSHPVCGSEEACAKKSVYKLLVSARTFIFFFS